MQGRLAAPDAARQRLRRYPVALTFVAGRWALAVAELRLLRRLANGSTWCAVCSHQGAGVNTIPSQLKCVLVKAGTIRQADLPLVLAGSTLRG